MTRALDIPAFPRDHAADGHNGMTLRDYFAAKAMQALISARCYPWDKQVPSYAYNIADAMLAVRDRPRE